MRKRDNDGALIESWFFPIDGSLFGDDSSYILFDMNDPVPSPGRPNPSSFRDGRVPQMQVFFCQCERSS